MAKIARKTAAAASLFWRSNEDPYDSESVPAYHFSYFVQDRLEARLDNACAASAVEHCGLCGRPARTLLRGQFWSTVLVWIVVYPTDPRTTRYQLCRVRRPFVVYHEFIVVCSIVGDCCRNRDILPARPCERRIRVDSATLKSTTVLLSQEIVV